MTNALRWIAVLPAAIAAYAVLQVYVIVLELLLAVPESAMQVINQFIASALCAYYFVFVGARVAPNARPVVAIVLAVLVSALNLLVAFVLVAKIMSDTTEPLWLTILELLCGVAAAVFACVRVAQHLDEPEEGPARWQTPVNRVMMNLFGMLYAYGYFGQGVLYLDYATGGFHWGVQALIGLFFVPLTLFSMILTWDFWLLVGVTVVAYFGMTYFGKRLEPSAMVKQPA
jgi:hypothetical protein